MKACTYCGETKPYSAFYARSSRPSHPYTSGCKDCLKSASLVRHHRTPPRPYVYNSEVSRRGRLKYNHGITVSEFDSLLAKQEGRCAICGTDTPGGRGTWHVDHDHLCCPGKKGCGKCIRGLLCYNCNVGLGQFRDSPSLLASASAYLTGARA